MSNVQAFAETFSSPVVADDFEEGWDRGVDWASERAVYRSLALVQQLHTSGCNDIGILTETLDCKPIDIFGRDESISQREVAGFIDGAVAILKQEEI